MYVRLLTVKNIEINGKMQTYHPGDWLEVGKSQAMKWLTDHTAEVVNQAAVKELTGDGCAIIICGNDYEHQSANLRAKLPQVEITGGGPRAHYKKTLIWQDDLKLRLELVPAGFHLLDTWEMCIPIASYKHLADSIGTKEERETTKALIHDLRVPYYDSRMIWVRRGKGAIRVIEDWQADVAQGLDPDLSLLRAVYKHKPFLLSLPITWTQGRDAF